MWPMTRSTASSPPPDGPFPAISETLDRSVQRASVTSGQWCPEAPHARPSRGGSDMKDSYRVVIIGGGVVGTSVLYHLAKFGWTGCLPSGTLGPDGGLQLARGGRVSRAQCRSEHGRASGLHDRPSVRDPGGIGPGHRPAHDRRPDHGGHARPLGMAAIGLPRVPVHRHRRLPPRHPRRGRRVEPDHVDRGFPGWHVGRPRGLSRHHRHRARLCQGRQETRRVLFRAHQGRKPRTDEATAGRSSPTRARSPASTWSTPPVSGPSRWAAWRGSSCPSRR
jgi:hypothetical protein